MGLIQRIAKAVVSKKTLAAWEASTRQWALQCGCGHRTDLWDAGGIRHKTSGRPLTATRWRCPKCGVTWHKLVHVSDPPPA